MGNGAEVDRATEKNAAIKIEHGTEVTEVNASAMKTGTETGKNVERKTEKEIVVNEGIKIEKEIEVKEGTGIKAEMEGRIEIKIGKGIVIEKTEIAAEIEIVRIEMTEIRNEKVVMDGKMKEKLEMMLKKRSNKKKLMSMEKNELQFHKTLRTV